MEKNVWYGCKRRFLEIIRTTITYVLTKLWKLFCYKKFPMGFFDEAPILLDELYFLLDEWCTLETFFVVKVFCCVFCLTKHRNPVFYPYVKYTLPIC